MLEALTTAFYVFLCVFLFAFAILIHEFGHFVVALKLGLRVEAFSVFFGKPIWKKKVGGVEYRLGWIPLGGYVSIPDVDPEGTKVIEGATGASSSAAPRARIPAWKEIAVAFAGPAMNLVLAAALAVVLALVPGVRFGTLPPKIGAVVPEGPAAAAGMKAGDFVKSVGGHAVESWTDMLTEVQIAGGNPVEFVVARGGGADGAGVSDVALTVTPKRSDVTGGWYILALSETNDAARAAAWMPARSPWRQLAWDAGSIFRVLKGLVTPKSAKATAGALGGPVMIAEGLYQQVRRDVWDGFGFLRFINVNLAVLNLLPIPVLDGGLILFALVALVFRRRLPDWFVSKVTLVFMALLIGAMAILLFRDGVRSYKIHTFRPGRAASTNSVERIAAGATGGTNDVHETADPRP